MAQHTRRLYRLGADHQNGNGEIRTLSTLTNDVDMLHSKLTWLQYPPEYKLKDQGFYHRLDSWGNYRRQACTVVEGFLPPNIRAALKDFKENYSVAGIVVRGLPVDEPLPPTPNNGHRPNEKAAISESILIGIAQIFGQVFSYWEESDGAPILQHTSKKNMNLGEACDGQVYFNMLSDNTFLPRSFRQSYTGLYGLRNEGDVVTIVLPVTDILKQLNPRYVRDLRQPLYRLKSPPSFDLGDTYLTDYGPVLYTDSHDRECIRLSRMDVEPKNSLAKSAFEEFRCLIEDVMKPIRIIMSPGTLCLFRNDLCILGHGAEQSDQWLQKIYISQSLAALRQKTKSDEREFCFSVRQLLGLTS